MEVINLPGLPHDLKYDINKLQTIIQTLKRHNINYKFNGDNTPRDNQSQYYLNKCVMFKKKFTPFEYNIKDLNSYHDALAYRFIDTHKSYLRCSYPVIIQEYFLLPRFEIFENLYFEGKWPEKCILFLNNKFYKIKPDGNSLFSSDFYIPLRNITHTNIILFLPPGETYECGIIGGYFNYFNPLNLFKDGKFEVDKFIVKEDGSCIYDGDECIL